MRITRKEIVVVGGGTAGFAAAVSAARNGADTLLVERYGFIGGAMTNGLVYPMMTSHFGDTQINRGILKEVVDKLTARGGSLGPLKCVYDRDTTMGSGGYITQFDSEMFRCLAFEMLEDVGVDVRLHTFVTEAAVEPGAVRGIHAVSKSGNELILADVIIDATGDADVAWSGGAKCVFGSESTCEAQPMTLFFHLEHVDVRRVKDYVLANRDQFVWMTLPQPSQPVPPGFEDAFIAGSGFLDLIAEAKSQGELDFGRDRITFYNGLRKGQFACNATRIPRLDPTTAEGLTQAEMEGHRQISSLMPFLRSRVPGFQDAYLSRIGTQVGVRESRHIVGDYVLTGEDILRGARFEDAIAVGAFPLDIHGSTATVGTWVDIDSPYDIPYSSLIPRGLNGILVAGRCISATHEGAAAMRVIPIVMSTGEAAGVAAALAVKSGLPVREVPVKDIQRTLVAQGAFLRNT